MNLRHNKEMFYVQSKLQDGDFDATYQHICLSLMYFVKAPTGLIAILSLR